MRTATSFRSFHVLLVLFVASFIFTQVAGQTSCSESPITQCERIIRAFIVEANTVGGIILRSRCPEIVQAAQCIEDYYDNCIFDIFRPFVEAFVSATRSLIQFACQGFAPPAPPAQQVQLLETTQLTTQTMTTPTTTTENDENERKAEESQIEGNSTEIEGNSTATP